jgi:hypothetical protein
VIVRKTATTNLNPRDGLMSYRYRQSGRHGHRNMEKLEVTEEDLMRLAHAMAQKLPDLECPECCDCGWKYQYVELSARFYREEWEWACLSGVLVQYQLKKRRQNTNSDLSR